MAKTNERAGHWKGAMEAAGKRFVGRATNKIDAKGRVSVPPDLRRYLEGPDPAESLPMVLRVAVGFKGQELWCGGPDLPEVLFDIARSDEAFANIENDRAIEDAVFEEIELLKFDENGRVSIPHWMRDEAALGARVTFGGRGAYFVVSDADKMDEARRSRRRFMADNADIIDTRSGPVRVARKGGPTS